MDPSTFELIESIARLSGGALLALVVVLLVSNRLLVTKVRHDEVVAAFERLLAEKDAEIARLDEDRDWWKDATVTALQIGEVVVERTQPPRRS